MKVNPINNSIYFQGGLKKNLHQGERVLKKFKSEYPYLNSNTFWQGRLDNMKYKKGANYTKYQYAIDNIEDIIRAARSNIFESDNSIKTMKQELAGKGYGNCGEVADLIAEKLDREGIKHEELGFRVMKGRSRGNNHVFSVIGLDKIASLHDPSTWGNKAVIIDGWMNFVLSAPDAIKEYEKFFDAKHRKRPFHSDLEFGPRDLV